MVIVSQMRIVIYVLIFFVWSIASMGQNINNDLITDFENLSGIRIADIKQDKTGFLWIGTEEGLYRFDGYNFKLYEAKEKAIGTSVIQTIYIDSREELWVGTRGGLLKYDANKDEFILFRHNPADTTTIHNNIINTIVEDQDHNIWIGLSLGGLDLYNRAENVFYHFLSSDGSGLLSDDISDLHMDSANHLWISTWDYGINRLDLNVAKNKKPISAQFIKYAKPDHFPPRVVINFLYEDPRSKALYVGTNESGLFKYDQGDDQFKPIKIPELEISVYSVTPFSAHQAWVCTGSGIYQVNLETGVLESFPKPFAKIKGRVDVIFKDKQNISWIGTAGGLIKHIEKKITHQKLDEVENTSPVNNILGLSKQGQYLWIGTHGGGLFLKDEKNDRLIHVNAANKLLAFIWDIKLVDNRYLLVAVNGGLVRIDVSRMSFRNSFPETNFPIGKHFTSFTKNKDGDTWASTWRGGLYKIERATGALKKYNKFSTDAHYAEAVLIDRKNQLWVGTVHSGLIKLTNLDGIVQATTYSERSDSSNRLSSDCISEIYEDKEGKIWIGTGGGGINILDPKTGKIEWILKGNRNLPSNTVKAFLEDKKGVMWISFKNGLSRYDPQNGFINYGEEDGLDYSQFNFNATEQTDSLVYFGSQQGYNFFNPQDLKFQETSSKAFITDFIINNKPVNESAWEEFDLTLTKPIYQTEDLVLNYKGSTLSFEFSSLDFTNPQREIYAYKLEGVDNDWTYTNASNRQVTYSNLTPGKYVFNVKTIRNNSTSVEKGNTIEINIVPPFWQTPWFKIISFLVFIGIVYAVYGIRIVRLRQQKIRFEKLADERIKVIEKKNIEIQEQTAKLHEADISKLNFFTNISHEFRTPLMLIIGPLTRLLEEKSLPAENEKLTMIHRNAQRLLRLMDQIMDISKIDAGRLTLELTKGDIIQFIRDIAHSFEYLADLKKIQFDCKADREGYDCSFDHDKLEKILYNILSNAFKVTPQEGSIFVTMQVLDDAEQKKLRIGISNTGAGISKDDLPHLFTRFYRTRSYAEGTGIGLSLTKSLVALQGGTIEVKSEENVGTTFYVTIPLREETILDSKSEVDNGAALPRRLPIVESDESRELSSNVKASQDPDAKTILIVDDDRDMCSFISQLLEPFYTVVRAEDGLGALKLAYQLQPDLIISDMIMPVMDGYEFLRTLKADTNVSHIPIILLTAKGSVESRLQGLEEGADDYITKPFNEKILLARVKNLIEQRRLMKERFSTDIYLKPKEITITSLDEKFMQSLVDLVEMNIADPDLNADVICQELGIGRSYLYAKVKAITDLSVNEFIKTLRLKHAAVLLINSEQNVNEVAISVGFNDRSHFSKSFAKQFGVSPAQYQREKLKS